jgi:hypothetical protein
MLHSFQLATYIACLCWICTAHSLEQEVLSGNGEYPAAETQQFVEVGEWLVSDALSPTHWRLRDRRMHSPEHVKQAWRNKRIVFIGDSLTRYQTLNLIHFLHTNSWAPSDPPHIEMAKVWGEDWWGYKASTTLRFGCRMICDGFRHWDWQAFPGREHRYYHDQSYNLSIDLHVWLPRTPMLANDRPAAWDFVQLCSNLSRIRAEYEVFEQTAKHNFGNNITEFIRRFVGPQNPDILVVNQGIWEFPELRTNRSFLNDFVSSLQESAKRVIWKVTTAACDPAKAVIDDDAFLGVLRSRNVELYDTFKYSKDVAFRAKEVGGICWDKLHYEPFVYRELNIKLIDQLMEGNRQVAQ